MDLLQTKPEFARREGVGESIKKQISTGANPPRTQGLPGGKVNAEFRALIHKKRSHQAVILAASFQPPVPCSESSLVDAHIATRQKIANFICLVARRFLTAFSGDSNSDQISPSCVTKHREE